MARIQINVFAKSRTKLNNFRILLKANLIRAFLNCGFLSQERTDKTCRRCGVPWNVPIIS